MTEARRGEPTTVEVIRQASKGYLRQAEVRREAARGACKKSGILLEVFRQGKAARLRHEDSAAYRHEASVERVDQIVSGATSFKYKEEPEEDSYVKWDLEIVSGGKKIKIGARHFLGGLDVHGGTIGPFQAEPHVQIGGNDVGGDERFDVTERFKAFVDHLKGQGVIGKKIKVGSGLSLPSFVRL